MTTLSTPSSPEGNQEVGGRATDQGATVFLRGQVPEHQRDVHGRKTFGQVDRRLRQAFPQEVFVGCSCLIFGDFGQYPPLMDLALSTTDSCSKLSDQRRKVYQTFQKALGPSTGPGHMSSWSGPDILHWLRDAKVTVADWKHLMTCTPTGVQDIPPFATALHLILTVEAVVEWPSSRPVASPSPLSRLSTLDPMQPRPQLMMLEAVVFLAKSARVMLTSNLWVDVVLVN